MEASGGGTSWLYKTSVRSEQTLLLKIRVRAIIYFTSVAGAEMSRFHHVGKTGSLKNETDRYNCRI